MGCPALDHKLFFLPPPAKKNPVKTSCRSPENAHEPQGLHEYLLVLKGNSPYGSVETINVHPRIDAETGGEKRAPAEEIDPGPVEPGLRREPGPLYKRRSRRLARSHSYPPARCSTVGNRAHHSPLDR